MFCFAVNKKLVSILADNIKEANKDGVPRFSASDAYSSLQLVTMYVELEVLL